MRDERKKAHKIRDLEGELAELKIHLRKMKASNSSHNMYSTGEIVMRRPASPVII